MQCSTKYYLSQVRRGYGPGHMKKGMVGGVKSTAVEDKALYISAAKSEEDICLEFSSRVERDRWAVALQRVSYVQTNWPGKVKP